MKYSRWTAKFNVKEVFLIVLVLLSIHFTEFKVGVIKLSEITLLLIPPFLYSKRTSKWVFYFYFLFFIWFIVSIAFNPFREFPPLKGLSILKRPYLITIGRFLELIACLNLAAIVHHYFRKKMRSQIISFIEKIVLFSFFLIIYNSTVYFLATKNIISDSNLVYLTSSNYYRLKGWFIEGGPYGLMLSFIFVLSFFYRSRYNFLIRSILILNIVFLAKSKAGMLLLVLWGVIYYYKTIYKRIKSLSPVVLVIGVLMVSFAFVKLAKVYIEHIENMEEYVILRPNDTNLTMGRIAGSHIAPKMVLDNPVLGIGLGNYPLERNVPKYRSFIPYTPDGKTDAHGLGGIVQILVDGGIFILFFFLLILFLTTKKAIRLKNNLEIYFFIFPCFFMAGVQVYFLYPWFLYGILISLNEKSIEKE